MKRILILLVVGLGLSTSMFAATSAAGVSTVSPTLTISVTVQKAVSLTLSTGNTAGVTGHCAVTAGTDYTMNFGTVDALAINDGNCNKIAPLNPGVDKAVYWTDYRITPVFTSQTAGTGTVTAYVSTNFTGGNVSVVRSSTADSSTIPVLATNFLPMSIASGTPDALATTAEVGVGGAPLTSFIGVSVAPTSGAAILTGVGSATVTFTLTAN